MSAATKDREKASSYADGDVLGLLYAQHARVHDLLEAVSTARGADRIEPFEELKTLLKAHETAEQAVVRPVTSHTARGDVAAKRTSEEQQADLVIRQIGVLDASSEDFELQFRSFQSAVTQHAEAEEREEFPTLDAREETQRLALGAQFLKEFYAAGGRD